MSLNALMWRRSGRLPECRPSAIVGSVANRCWVKAQTAWNRSSRCAVRASMLEVIRTFLRDNNVNLDAPHALDVKEQLEKLRGLSLPFDEEAALKHRQRSR